MLATVHAATLHGIDGRVIRVEVDVAPGLPGFTIVGLPDAALQEARERVRGAIRNSGLAFPPRRITVNLAPADLRKAGASLDLAIAIGILLGSDQVRATGRWAFIGELSLGGDLRAVPGTLPMVVALAERGSRRIVVPSDAAAEAALAPEVDARPASDLAQVVELLRLAGSRRRRNRPAPPERIELAGDGQTGPIAGGAGEHGQAGHGRPSRPNAGPETPDLADIRGQAVGRRALEIALAGGHGLLLTGPPGSGKTMLARTIPGLLPPLSDAEARVASTIASVAGEGPLTGLVRSRPFRAPHHTISYAGMIGGGPRLAPGEVTRADEGVLFLDELPEFGRDVLEALRQPLEDGRV
ncbi:MAG TPA: ATP-binding protein, partial [Patescibacteria group bacterium]|nr:ATP-binding protein [Patescibacteria group bacterium]